MKKLLILTAVAEAAIDLAEAKKNSWIVISLKEWLSGEKEPGGSYTFQLLRWVEQQERQPK